VPEFSQVERAMIVVLAEREDPHRVARDHGVTARHVYRHALNGFAGNMADLARSGLLRDQRVVRVRPDQTLTINETQFGAPWSLDRIDQRTAALDGTYTYQESGAGVSAYIVDTGIDFPPAAVPGSDSMPSAAADRIAMDTALTSPGRSGGPPGASPRTSTSSPSGSSTTMAREPPARCSPGSSGSWPTAPGRAW
jgi:hypothetical protein